MTYQEFYAQNKERFLEELKQFLRFKSISTDDAYKQDIKKTYEWVIQKLTAIGIEDAKPIWPHNKTLEQGNPVVVGHKIFDASLPTLLVYGHYDVQPAEEGALWNSDPFEPVIKDGQIYARGTTDNKGQIFTNIIGLEYYLNHAPQENRKWNIKVFIEGEEEISGQTTEEIIESNDFDNEIKSDYAYISDGPWNDSQTPSIEYSLRGLAYYDLHITTADHDVHSGLYGNAILNPINLAGYIIYKLKDIRKNKVRVPNFYKSVRKQSQEELKELNSASPSWEQIKEETTAKVTTTYLRKDSEWTALSLTGLRPSFDVHGIQAGYTEWGKHKTIIPSKASIKFSFRLVPYQTPEVVTEQVKKYLSKIIPKGVEWELVSLGNSMPYLTDPNDKQIIALKAAYETGFGKKPVLTTSGGSIGLVNVLKQTYGITTLLANYGLPNDNLHAPNEKYSLENLEKGFYTFVEFLTK